MGFRGDGGPAISESAAFPTNVAVGNGDNLFISDLFNSRIRRVILMNQSPVADAGPDRTAIVAETLEFDGTGSSHPDGSIISYEWDFGDGTSGSGEIVTHTYAALGSFTVILTVTDSDGATATDTAVVTVLTVSQAIQELPLPLVKSFDLQQGIESSLDAKLQSTRDSLDAANAVQRQDAAEKLQVFINEVEAQRGKELTSAQADQLIALATRTLALL